MQNVPLIAIVDDSASMRDAIFGLIRSLGYQAEVFESAEAFLASTGNRTFNCLILDVAMPGLSGIQLQARLNEQGSSPPIIFVTSRDDNATRDVALKAGATCFLGKPVDDTQLISCLHSALGDLAAENSKALRKHGVTSFKTASERRISAMRHKPP